MGEVGQVSGQAFGTVMTPFLTPLAMLQGKDAWHYQSEMGDWGEDITSGRAFSDMLFPDYEMPEAPKPPELPEAPAPEAPVETGDEGIRKGAMLRQSKKRALGQLHLTKGQPRDDNTLGGYRTTLA